jgi:hypothetical protein
MARMHTKLRIGRLEDGRLQRARAALCIWEGDWEPRGQTGSLSWRAQGDSGFMLVRAGAVVFKSPVLQHFFDCPFQFGACPDYSEQTDSAEDAAVCELAVQPGDVILAGSDGLWDNCYDEELLPLLPDGPEGAQQARMPQRPSCAFRLLVVSGCSPAGLLWCSPACSLGLYGVVQCSLVWAPKSVAAVGSLVAATHLLLPGGFCLLACRYLAHKLLCRRAAWSCMEPQVLHSCIAGIACLIRRRARSRGWRRSTRWTRASCRPTSWRPRGRALIYLSGRS